MNLNSLNDRLNIYTGKINQLESDYSKQENDFNSIQIEIRKNNQAIELAKKCIEKSIELRHNIEDIISQGLTEVFGEEYIFKLEVILDDEGNIKGLNPQLSGWGNDADSMDSFSDGEQAILTTCYNIAMVLLTPSLPKFIVFDEPWASLSLSLQARIREFIEKICVDTGLQIIIVTHMSEPFGRIWEVKKVKNKAVFSIAKEIKIETLLY